MFLMKTIVVRKARRGVFHSLVFNFYNFVRKPSVPLAHPHSVFGKSFADLSLTAEVVVVVVVAVEVFANSSGKESMI